MSRALFVSDIHISSPQDPKAHLFLRLLDALEVQKFDHLFLVGDIFDLWIGDRRFFVETYAPIVERLRHLRSLGLKIHYFEGNHDLDLRPYWQHRLGFDVYSEAAFFELNGLRFRVEHGDQMDPTDRGYLFLRWLLRTPVMVFLARNLPDQIVSWIGRRASNVSREYTTQVKAASTSEVLAKIHRHLRQVSDQAPFDILVSGHVHVSDDSQHEHSGRRLRSVNMGTWLKEPLLFEVRENGMHLKKVEEWISAGLIE